MGHWLHQFIRESDSDVAQPLRIRLFRLMCATTAGLCLVVVLPMNMFQNLPIWVNLADILLGLFAGYCLWASVRERHYFLAFFLMLLASLTPIWFLNAGSEGSITYYYFAAVIYPLAVMRGRTRWVLTTLVCLNACGLLLLEHFHPELTVPFQNASDRLIDLLTGVFCSLLATVAVVWLILKAYDQEQIRLTRYARELAAGEQKYREIFNSTGDAIFIRDENGELLDFNERVCTLFGYSREEAGRLSINDLSAGASPYSQKEALRHIQRAHQEGPQVFRWHSRCKNGELFWSEITLHVAGIAGQKRLIAVVRDISARIRAEEALRTNEERLRLALSASRQGWFEINVQTGQGSSSEEYLRIIGYEPDGYVTTTQGWLEGIHPEDRERASREYQACVAAGDTRTLEYRRRTKSGEWKWIRSVGKIVEFDARGRPLRMAGTHTDITEHKELEKKLLHSQRLESVGTLAAGVAHDLNNILTPMLMASSVLGDKLPDAKDQELMSLIEGGAKRGATIVRQLLAFSRDLAQSRVRVDVAQLIRETRALMHSTFPPDITLKVELPADLRSVAADPTQLHQVLMNLCLNARDAMPHGGTLTLRAENLRRRKSDVMAGAGNEGEAWIEIQVADTGGGIPPEIIGRIFDPFYSTKEAGKGTGLGLSTVYGIVKGHGGTIAVESQPPHGTTFRITLPAIGAANGIN